MGAVVTGVSIPAENVAVDASCVQRLRGNCGGGHARETTEFPTEKKREVQRGR